MSQKQIKKEKRYLRQLFREKYLSDAHLLAEEHMKFLKTKPNWMPMPIWIFMLSFFVKINR